LNLAAVRGIFPGSPAPGEIYFRLVNKPFAATIDDIGPAFRLGWRYNPKDEFGVLYLASSAHCSYLEKLRQVNGRAEHLPPQVLGAFRVRIERNLDLTDPAILKLLAIKPEDLTADKDFTTPQALAREARFVGFESLLVPSAAGALCKNLVVFKDKLSPPSYCQFDQATLIDYIE